MKLDTSNIAGTDAPFGSGLGRLLSTRAAVTGLIAFGVSFLVVLLDAVNALFIEGSFLNFSGDDNLPAAASALLFAWAAVLCFQAARSRPSGDRAAWAIIAVIAAAFAVESLVGLHDRVEGIHQLRTVELLLLPVIGVIAAVIVGRGVMARPRPIPLLLAASALAFASSQAIGAFESLIDIEGTVRYALVVGEEWGEMLCAVLLILGAAYERCLGESRATSRAEAANTDESPAAATEMGDSSATDDPFRTKPEGEGLGP